MSESDNETQDYLLKIIVIGAVNVGKTKLISRYVNNEFVENGKNTIGVDFFLKNYEIEDKKIKIQFWDTAGQERYKSTIPNYYKNVNGIIIAYDITNKESFHFIEKLFSQIEENCDDLTNIKMIIFGNKLDLIENREVNQNEIEELKINKNIKIIEMSAKTNEGNKVHENINNFIEEVYKKAIENFENNCKKEFNLLKKKSKIDLNNHEKKDNEKNNKKSSCC